MELDSVEAVAGSSMRIGSEHVGSTVVGGGEGLGHVPGVVEGIGVVIPLLVRLQDCPVVLDALCVELDPGEVLSEPPAVDGGGLVIPDVDG